MALVKLLLPKTLVKFDETTDIVFFLAGPIKGANDWQREAILLLQKNVENWGAKKNVYVVCPSMYQSTHELYPLKLAGISEEFFTEEQKKITRSRTDWERYHLEIASRLGSIIFWLGKEDEQHPRQRHEGPYARDSYGELGEWRARMYYEKKFNNNQVNLVIGADSTFHGLAQIDRNFRRMVGEDFKIYETLQGTIERAAALVTDRTRT